MAKLLLRRRKEGEKDLTEVIWFVAGARPLRGRRPSPPNGLEMSRPASSSSLHYTRFAAAGRVGSIELLGRPGVAGEVCLWLLLLASRSSLCEAAPAKDDQEGTDKTEDRSKGEGESPPENGAYREEE